MKTSADVELIRDVNTSYTAIRFRAQFCHSTDDAFIILTTERQFVLNTAAATLDSCLALTQH